MPLDAGTRFGPYEIRARVGAGGMGEVYRAHDPRLDRDVALKVLPEGLARDPERLRRFEKEARAAGGLNHPNVVAIHDVGRSETGLPFLVSELLEGETLRDRLRRGGLSIHKALEYARQVADGLAAAHARGILHRDLKPENLFLTRDGRVKILDFGLARHLEPSPPVPSDLETGASTSSDTLVGTAPYMSPEQVRRGRVDARSDIFSLGVVLYELLAGRRPFGGDTAVETMTAILRQDPLPLSPLNPDVPPGVERLVSRCLQKPPEERFQSCRDLALAIETLSAVPSASRRRADAEDAEEPCPYPGLAAFGEADAERFFGREDDVSRVWSRVKLRPLVALIGPSGAGKTSFVRAGVVAARPPGWAAVVATPGSSPLRMLGQALAPELAGDPEALRKLVRFDEPDTAFEVVSRWRRGHAQALLVVDQLEELFTLNDPPSQAAFARLLGRLASEADVHVLVSLRDDFLMPCGEHEGLRDVFEELVPLLPLSREGLRRALVEPAERVGYAFEEASLVETMLDAVEGERAALPLLAFAVAQLWGDRDRERRLLTHEGYAAIGGVAGALAQHAEEVLERIGGAGQGVVRELFRNLVTAQGTRAVREREELLSVLPDRHEGERVLDRLVEARLLTSFEVEGGDGEPQRRIEVVHESLLEAWPRLVRWRAQDEEGAVLRDQLRQAAHLWHERGRPADLLWAGTSYRELELWRERYPGGLTAVEGAFAAATVARARRRTRQRKAAAVSLVAASLAVTTAVGVLWRRAVSGTQRAEAARVVTLGRLQLDTYPTAALAYARKSLEIADGDEARLLVVRALWRGAAARVLPLESGSWSAAFSPDGSQLAAATFSENLLVVSDDGQTRLLSGFTQPAGPSFVGFAPSGNRVLARTPDDKGVMVAELSQGGPPRMVQPTLADGTAPRLFGHWPLQDGILFLTDPPGSNALPMRVWPYDGGEATLLGTLRGPVSRLFVGPSSVTVDRSGRLSRRPLRGDIRTPELTLGTYDDTGVWSRSMDPGRQLMAAARRDGRLTLIPLPEREGVVRRQLEMEAPDEQCLPAFDRTGSRLAWGSSVRHAVSLWDLSGPADAPPRELRRADARFNKALLFHPESHWLASVNYSSLTFWAIGLPWSRVLAGHTSQIAQLLFTPDSKFLLSCGDNDGVSMWPLAPTSGRSRRQLSSADGKPDEWCYGMGLSPDGSHVLWGAVGATLSPVDGKPGRWVIQHSLPAREVFTAAAFDPGGRWVVTANGYTRHPTRKLFRVWSPGLGRAREWPQAPSGEGDDSFDWSVDQLRALSNGHVLAAGNRGVRRLDPATGQSHWIWRLGRSEFARLGASADGAQVVGIKGSDTQPVGPAFVLDPEGGRAPQFLASHGSRVSAVALDASGQILATGDELGTVRVGRLDGAEPHLLLGHEGKVLAVEISPDGRWIASAAGSEIRLWPMPDLTRRPLHGLLHDELMEKLRSFTNVEAVEDATAPGGYRLEIGPFPGWKDVPTW